MFSNLKAYLFSASTAVLLLSAAACDEEAPQGAGTLPSSIGAAGGQAFPAGGSSAPATLPPPPPPPAIPTTTTTSTTASLVVENHYTNLSITGLFLSPSTRQSWGPNQLDVSIAPGRTFTLRNIPCLRNYDLKLTASSGKTLPIVTGVYFGCGIEKVVSVGN